MTDYKQLCAELVEAWDATADFDYNDFGNAAADIVDRARTALAEPEPEGPTDKELSDLWSWSASQDQGPYPTQQHCFARAVLALWGNHPGSPDSSTQPS